MKDPEPPPWQDRMTGVYCRPRCPHCRAAPGPDCADMATRKRRHVENDQLRRYADTALAAEQAAADAENDVRDCRHGCNGLCVVSSGDRCDFTCHDTDTVAYFEELYDDHQHRCPGAAQHGLGMSALPLLLRPQCAEVSPVRAAFREDTRRLAPGASAGEKARLMCGLCADAVEICYPCSLPPVREDGTRRERYLKVFYLDDLMWCEHLTEKHGTDSPRHYAHFMWGDHTGDDCECVTQGWYPDKEPPTGWEDE